VEILVGENFGELQAKLHLAKKILAKAQLLSPFQMLQAIGG